MDNPLLAMLKQATAGGPVGGTPGAPSSMSPDHSAQSAASVSPPPSLQAVSLDDLFKSISSPPLGSSNNHSSFSTPSGPGPSIHPAATASAPAPAAPGHQAKLLGMLSLGMGGAPPTGSVTPETRPVSGAPVTPSQQEERRRSSLLNVLRSPTGVAPTTLAEPVINHPLPAAVASVPAIPETQPAASHPAVVSPPLPSPPSAAATPLNRSIFDFVSPFDAFESPKPRSRVPSAAPAAPPVSQQTAPVLNAHSAPQNAPQSATQSAPRSATQSAGHSGQHTPAQPSLPTSPANGAAPGFSSPATNLLQKTPSESPAIKQVQNARSDARRGSAGSAAAPPPAKKVELSFPYLSSKIFKNTEGSGPKTLSSSPVTIDLSRDDATAVVNTPGTVQVIPTTIMKAENTGFQRGRTVAYTKGWLAYTLSRGRVRLIDRSSGARTVLQLDSTGPIVDLAATANAVAAIGSDGSVSVYTVPESWARDDPPCPLVFHLGPIDADLVPAEKNLGTLNHLEWVRRTGPETEWLAIGGTEGVVVVKPSDWSDKPEVDPLEVFASSKVLKASGTLVSFCLNASHQAIGLLSAANYFSLYSVANLNRVWHRQLPSSAPSLEPTSASFCEANILIGRANNTVFDLVQITVELAVLSTVKFTVPSTSPTPNYTHAEYDSERETLFVAPFARGCLYAFHYALKGQAPSRDTSGVVAFDSVVELPLEPVVSFVVGPSDGDVEVFFSTPTGINQASIDASVFPDRKTTPPAPAAEQPKPVKQQVEKKNRRQAPTKVEPVTEDEQPTTSSGQFSSDDLAIALKRSEDKLSNQFRQMLQKELAPLASRSTGDADLASSVSAAVGTHIKTHLPNIVQQELKRIMPSAVAAEVRQVVSEHAPAAIHQSLQGLSRDIERSITPAVSRTVTSVVQPTVERAVQDAFSQALVPALNHATNRVYDQLAADLKTEMVQIRKDIVAEQSEALGMTNDTLHTMAGTIVELQKQIAALSAQVARGAVASTPTHPTQSAQIMSPPRAVAPIIPPAFAQPKLASAAAPAPAVHANAQQLEDTFLAALQQQSVGSTLKLVSDYASRTDEVLPSPPNRCPLSQAVLLTLLHRLSLALSELQTHDPVYQTAATWLRRAVVLVDPHDPAISNFFGRVAGVVSQALNGVINTLGRQANDPMAQAHAHVLRQTLDLLNRKL